jgi:drug/metabolite transporter (DMT)-like permease
VVLAIGLALSASVLWGLSDFVGGSTSRRLPVVVVLAGSQAVALALLAPVVLATGDPVPDTETLVIAAASGAAGVAALGSLYLALALGRMSVVAPLSSTAVAIPVLYALAGGERPAPLELAGIALAALGVIVVSRSVADGNDAAPKHERASIALALVAAVGVGVFFTGTDHAAAVSASWTLLTSRVAELAVATLALAALRPNIGARLDPRALVAIAAIGLVDVVGTAAFALATREGMLSVVSVLAALYPVTTALLARSVLGERMPGWQGVGVLAALTGAALIAAG